jgi:hypothetical protein
MHDPRYGRLAQQWRKDFVGSSSCTCMHGASTTASARPRAWISFRFGRRTPTFTHACMHVVNKKLIYTRDASHGPHGTVATTWRHTGPAASARSLRPPITKTAITPLTTLTPRARRSPSHNELQRRSNLFYHGTADLQRCIADPVNVPISAQLQLRRHDPRSRRRRPRPRHDFSLSRRPAMSSRACW